MKKPPAPTTNDSPWRNASDNLCKRLAEQYPTQVAQWLFGVSQVEIAKTELPRAPIHADAVLFSHNGSETLHAEFQLTLKSRPAVPLRMLDYYVGLKRKHPRRRVRQVLVVLKPTDRHIPDRYEDHDTSHCYRVIKLWETNPQELLKYDGLLPLATLCQAESGETLLKAVAQRIRRIKSPELRRETFNASRLLAGLRYDAGVIIRTLQQGGIMEESVIYQDIIRTGELKLALKQLEQRFGKVSSKLQRQLEGLAAAQIEALGLALLDFKSKNELNDWLTRQVASR